MNALTLSVAAVMFLAAAAPAQTQQPRNQTSEQQTVEVVQGELLKVDPDARTISVRAPGGAEIQFAYTNETVITGSEEQTQGLATIEGTHVRVYFTRSDDAYTATRVVVEPEDR